MNKQQGLGRGLGSLIPSRTKISSQENIFEIPIDKIQSNPWQPRDHFADGPLQELVASIQEHGILQPLILTENKAGFELIAGERRLRAAKLLKLKTVPAIIRKAEEQQKLELALVENLHRADLNPMEKAVALRKLIDQFNYTQEQVAKKIGKSRVAVTNLLRLLQLPEEIQKALREGQITEGHARGILTIKEPKEQLIFFRKMKLGNWTVRDVERAGRKIVTGQTKVVQSRRDPTLLHQEEILQKSLGTRVNIQKDGRGGRIIIEFYSEEELGNLVRKLKGGN
jgi:ParB family chromosome partitioning protein